MTDDGKLTATARREIPEWWQADPALMRVVFDAVYAEAMDQINRQAEGRPLRRAEARMGIETFNDPPIGRCEYVVTIVAYVRLATPKGGDA